MATTKGTPLTDRAGPAPERVAPPTAWPRWSDPIVASLTAEFDGRLAARLVRGVIATYITCFAGTDEPSAATYATIERASREALACRAGAVAGPSGRPPGPAQR